MTPAQLLVGQTDCVFRELTASVVVFGTGWSGEMKPASVKEPEAFATTLSEIMSGVARKYIWV